MNLLLVDDEEYVIESIKKNVDWELLDIGRLYGILHAAGTDGHGTYAYPCDRE